MKKFILLLIVPLLFFSQSKLTKADVKSKYGIRLGATHSSIIYSNSDILDVEFLFFPGYSFGLFLQPSDNYKISIDFYQAGYKADVFENKSNLTSRKNYLSLSNYLLGIKQGTFSILLGASYDYFLGGELNYDTSYGSISEKYEFGERQSIIDRSISSLSLGATFNLSESFFLDFNYKRAVWSGTFRKISGNAPQVFSVGLNYTL